MTMHEFPIEQTRAPTRRLTRNLSILAALEDFTTAMCAHDHWIQTRLAQFEAERIATELRRWS